mgnify:CR=1 FL=1
MPEKKSLNEQVGVLFEGIEISEDQKVKFAAAFEALLSEESRSVKEALTAQKDEEVATACAELSESMEESINKYLEYVVTEWMEVNELAVEGGLKTEITEGFLKGLKDLFESSNIDIPESDEGVLAVAESKVVDLTAELNESLEKETTLRAQVEKFEKQSVVSENSAGLTDTQVEKFESLVEDVSFTNRAAYNTKVKHIRESFFKAESLNEGGEGEGGGKEGVKPDSRMAAYISAL